MLLLYTDESSMDPARHEFFVYGGVAIPSDSAALLHQRFEEIRTEYKISPRFLLKFNPGPPNLDHQPFIEVKRAVMAAAVEANSTLLVTIGHHRILTDVEEARRNEINRIAFHFDGLLHRRNDYGIILIDRFSDRQIDEHLREKFSVGLRKMPYSDEMRLRRVLGLHYSAIGQSHFSSLIDILIGSVRFTVDAFSHNTEAELATARTLLNQMQPLFVRTDAGGKVSVLSMNFSPKRILIDQYRRRYQGLKDFFTSCGIEPEQEITQYRTY